MNQKVDSFISVSEQTLLGVINNFDGVVYSLDTNFLLTSFNAEFKSKMKNIFNLNIEIGDHVYDFLKVSNPSEIPYWENIYRQALNGERLRFKTKIEYTNPNLYLEFSVNPIACDGEITGLACFCRDITNEKLKEMELERAQELFSLIADNPILGIVWADADGKMINANETFCKILESTLDDLLEVYYGDYTFPDDLITEKPLFENLKKGIIDNYVLEKRYITRKGGIKWVKVNLSTNKNETGKIRYITCIVQEIGERKESEKLLEQSETNLRAILDHTSASCLLLDNDFRIVAYNKLAENWMNIYFNHAFETGEFFLPLVPGKYQSLAEQVLQVAKAGMPYRYTGKYHFAEGELNWYDVHVAPAYNEKNEVRGIVISIVDITREKNSEAEIKALNETLEEKVKARTAQLEASNKEMEAFTYSISHDLRAQLRNINGFAEILLEDGADMLSNEMKKNLTVIKSNAVRMGLFIDSLLEISRLGRSVLNKKEVNMKHLVGELVEEIKFTDKKFKAEIILNEIHNIQGDASLLKQVWQNLISNAVKYSALKENPKIEIGSTISDGKIHYSVKDNGVGFEMQFSHKLFGVFQRLHRDTEFAGTGVGLAIVKRIVQKHNGQVGVQSTPNVGTTFYFSLPQ